MYGIWSRCHALYRYTYVDMYGIWSRCHALYRYVPVKLRCNLARIRASGRNWMSWDEIYTYIHTYVLHAYILPQIYIYIYMHRQIINACKLRRIRRVAHQERIHAVLVLQTRIRRRFAADQVRHIVYMHACMHCIHACMLYSMYVCVCIALLSISICMCVCVCIALLYT
jgi:hypothetical protein